MLATLFSLNLSGGMVSDISAIKGHDMNELLSFIQRCGLVSPPFQTTLPRSTASRLKMSVCFQYSTQRLLW